MSITNKIKNNFPLASLSTYHIGGPAEFFVAVGTKEELSEAIAWANEHTKEITILGGGSNILINDTGIKGLVIKLDNNTLEREGNRLRVGASMSVKIVAETAFDYGLSGIEWSIGIPGSMGGAIRGNAGAHGWSFDTVVKRVIVFDSHTFSFLEKKTEECGFAYRHSMFKEQPHIIIWETEIELVPGDQSSMQKNMDEYREYRRMSQPKEPSAGCVFKNFIASDLEKTNPEVVAMAAAEGKVRGGKIGAGYLIQKLGLMGLQSGGARISEKHANFVINADHAKAADVAEIMKITKEKVRKEYGVELEEEVQYLGF